MKVVSTKVTNPEWEALVDKCNKRGVTISEYLRTLLQSNANGRNDEDCDMAGRKRSKSVRSIPTTDKSLPLDSQSA